MDDQLYEAGLMGLPQRPAYDCRLEQLYQEAPFSYWDTRAGRWKERRRVWLAQGIKSELGRKDDLTYKIPDKLADGRKGNKIKNKTSVFDPVVCELVYQWWAAEGGVVLDPFAGGSVRGVVASMMGLRYKGIELRGEQVDANNAQVVPTLEGVPSPLCGKFPPKWIRGDAAQVLPKAPPADLVFSCPPYGNLEKYSDNPADISNMGYGQFLERYREIIALAAGRLQQDRFAVWVVGNYREGGFMRDLVGDSVRAWEDAGLRYYNDIVLLNSAGSAPMRANGTFLRGHRKVVKLHQNVLVFVKGDPAAAAALVPKTKADLEALRILEEKSSNN